MCSSCNKARRWRSGCLDGRGPSLTPSPPRYELPQYPQVVHQQYTPQPYPQAVAGPSNASSVYPGSNFARTPTHASSASTASDSSIHFADQALSIICSNHSINSLTRQLSQEIRSANALKTELDHWFQQINPKAYATRRPWHQGMQNAHDRYKQFAMDIGRPHKAFTDYQRATSKNTTPEQHIERARLAIEWGKAVVKASQARLDFQETYRDAYPLANIKPHIKEAESVLTGAQQALELAKINYNNIWTTAGRLSNPAVFQ